MFTKQILVNYFLPSNLALITLKLLIKFNSTYAFKQE